MALIQSPVALLAVLAVGVAVAELVGRLSWGRKVGAALIVIIVGALLANFRIVPPAGAGGLVYDPIFAVVTPAAIFLILLEANLKSLRKAGGPMLIAFGLGAAGTAAGVLVAGLLTPARAMLGGNFEALSGMFAGTYIGGSANFNAIALHYGVAREGGVYAAAIVVDNIATGVWILITVAMPLLLYRTGLFGKPGERTAVAAEEGAEDAVAAAPLTGSLAVALPLALALTGVVIANLLAAWLKDLGFPVPSILILTTLALVAAQIPVVARMTLSRPLGLYGVYVFLIVVGASIDIAALIASGPLGLMLMGFVTILMLVHGVVLITGAQLLKIEPEIVAIASNANIGGATSAVSLAEAFGREDLVLPGVIAGTLGTAIGTYIGFAVVAIL
ncbi:MAG: DUF819 family protein [Caulobacter sp.]|nr:DUF819 family protein [Caulobacter sp.]